MSKFNYKDYIKKNKFKIGNLKRYQERNLLSENLITEATRSHVGVIDKNGNITSTYVHYDGYPGYVGKILKQAYNGAKTKKLLKIAGKDGVSVLGRDIKGGKDHSFENPVKGQTIFYGRDRGDSGGDMMEKGKTSNIRKYISSVESAGAEYVYLYDEKDKKWIYFDIGKSRTEPEVL
jgi:hypothetical protein